MPEAPATGGPLEGIRVVEMAGIGPAPFAAMMLADFGADVVRVEQTGRPQPEPQPLHRGRRRVEADLKAPGDREAVWRLIERADVLIEGFRPRVMERLGLGPEACLKRNPSLVYGRMTGWGQDGAAAAGHDINYIAVAGVLDNIRRPGERPVVPLNLIGDFGGGGAFLAYGIVCALLGRGKSRRGQVVDAAMVDGAAALMGLIYGLRAQGRWNAEPGENLLDGGAPFYDVYETGDGGFVAVGALEPGFYRALVERLRLQDAGLPEQYDVSGWPTLREAFTRTFRSRTRDEWAAIFDGSDACVTPVLSMSEAIAARQLRDRGTFIEMDGVTQPAPAPRLSRTPAHAKPSRRAELEDASAAWS